MAAEFQLLKQAVSDEPSNRSMYRWENLLAAIEALAVGDSLGWEAERVLLRVVRLEGELRLNDDSEPPHSMSPEEMLKSVAIQTLASWTGLTHLLEMQRVEATASSPVLASIVRATIRKATPPKMPASKIEVVSEVRPLSRHEVVSGPLARSIGQRPVKALPKGEPKITVVGWKPVEGSDTTAGMLVFKGFRGVLSGPSRKKNIVNKPVILEHGLTFLPGRRGRMNRAAEEPEFV